MWIGRHEERLHSGKELLVRHGKLELVTEVEDESDVVKIYVAPDNDNDNIVSNLVILVQEPDEFVAINIAGKLDLTKLAQSIKSDTIDSGNLPLN